MSTIALPTRSPGDGQRSRRHPVLAAFTPPALPPVSRRAFRYHMGYALLDAVSAGILGNVPVMAIKAMQATDAQLQIPIAMTSVGLFASVFAGLGMATRRKKPFIVIPGIASAICALLMAWANSAFWFLFAAGMISIFDFSIRPAVPCILRSIYPEDCRCHVAGTLRQYASIVFLASTLLSAFALSAAGDHTRRMIVAQITLAGLSTLCAFLCMQQLPDRGDGSLAEAISVDESAPRESRWRPAATTLAPWRDKRFRRFLAIFSLYCFSNLFYMGIVPAFFARDRGFGYVEATLLIHFVPSVAGFLAGGRLTAWFDRTSVWRAFAAVALLWGLDPVLIAIAPQAWPVLLLARILRGPATIGSMVLVVYTGVHRFARPGADTSRYMSALFLVNGVARLIAPTTTAFVSGHLANRWILLIGGLGILVASALSFSSDREEAGATT